MLNIASTNQSDVQTGSLVDAKTQAVVERLTIEFVDSSNDILLSVENLLGDITVGAVSEQSAFDEVFRAAHNLKGSAATFGYPLVGAIAHRLEDYISDSGEIGRDQVNDIQIFIDKMHDVLNIKPHNNYVDAKAIIRSLPFKTNFDPRAVSKINVEILLIMPKGAGTRFVEQELRGCGYRVTNVPAPFMAFEMALVTQPDMIIASALLTDLDGIDIACAFKAMPTTQNIPFALITSLSSTDSRLKLLPEDVPQIRKGASFSEDLAQALNFLGVT